MAKYGLDLEQKNKSKKKRNITFVILFICFVIVLGTVSTLLLWRSSNYDFNNLFVKDDVSTTAAPTTTEPGSQIYTGEYMFLVAVTSDDGKKADFFNLINVNLEDKTIRVLPVDQGITDNNTGYDCGTLLVNNGIKSTVAFLNEFYQIKIDRYAVLKETEYKSFFRAMGDITIKIHEDVEYDTADMFLELNKGENVLTPDKTYKYMKYLCETKTGYDRAKANAEIIVAAFTSFCTPERFNSADNTFSVIIDYCTTDISIVDFTEAKDEIFYLIPKTSKEKLKVFVSDKIKIEKAQENTDEEK